ncbi:MAG: LamG-like jellyroll fold domain-containing protein, partial [Sandaracinaceae bacterium]
LPGTLAVGGRSDVVVVPAGDAIDLDSATLALSFTSVDTEGTQGILSRDASGYSGNGHHLSLYLRHDTLYARLQDGDGQTALRYEGIEAGRSYDIVLSFGDGMAELHVDGRLADTGATDLTWKDNPAPMQIGALGWSAKTGTEKFNNVFEGEISGLQIHEGVMTPAELAAAGEAPPAAPPGAPVVDAPVIEEPEAPVVEDPVAEIPEPAPEPQPEPEPEPAPAPEPEPAPAPEPEPEPEPQPAPLPEPEPEAPAEPQDPYAVEHGKVIDLDGKVQVYAGRVSTLDTGEDDVASIRILSGPQHGNLTVNPDNTLALVLSTSDKTSDVSFRYEVTYDDGSTKAFNQSLDVIRGPQADGWAEGNFNMLEEGADGNVVVVHGDVHRKVYISESDDALSAADIAALEGLRTSDITARWLADHPE